ncbi:unnamed protein product [Pleuronectes platessa]|uniref:Uncharacterized protein n=1 Tax=Pleuronectes platessa TaxID=8262 RepID=A0A9N7UJT0_PLEPL|nr:unnamed protein product [Pleuronectes platessa]
MLLDILAQLQQDDQVLQSSEGLVRHKMNREGGLEVVKKLHPEADRYAALVDGFVWDETFGTGSGSPMEMGSSFDGFGEAEMM